jgi:hypothetical protein
MNRFSKRKNSRSRPGNSSGGAAQLKAISRTLAKTLDVQQEQEGTLMANKQDIPWPMPSREKTYTFVRTVQLTPLTVTTAMDTTFAYTFTLSAFPDASDFTNLFDQYRIGVVRVAFFPQGGASQVINSVIGTAIDYDDSASGLALGQLEEYSTFQLNSLSKTFWRTFQPKASNAAYSGVFTSFTRMPASTWIDCASPAVLYYGLKGQIPASTISGGPFIAYNVSVSAILQFQNTR